MLEDERGTAIVSQAEQDKQFKKGR
jgi:hypothetical protein